MTWPDYRTRSSGRAGFRLSLRGALRSANCAGGSLSSAMALKPLEKRRLALGLVAFLLGTAVICSTIFSHTLLMGTIGLRALYILHLFAQLGLGALAWSLPSGRKRLREWKPAAVAIALYAGAV